MSRLLFFSRGRGRGHAVIDIEAGRELQHLREDVEITYVSYGTGARTFEERSIPVIDMGLPDMNSIAATTVIAGRIIGRLKPDLVVAHEEFAALPAAKIFGIKTAMITDFFGEPGKFSMESLWFADHILFLDREGLFTEPPSVQGKVDYLGPQIRHFVYSRADRGRARQELGIPSEATVVGVFPGSWTEAMAPIADRLLAACEGKHLLWLAGSDVDLIRERLKGRNGGTVLDTNWQIDRLMVASDLAISKANRMTVRELASLGIRTLSVSYGLNPTDDECIAPLQSNRTVTIEEFDRAAIEKSLGEPEPSPLVSNSRSCASVLSELIGRPSSSASVPATAE